MIGCIDVLYKDEVATVALVLFDYWHSDRAASVLMRKMKALEPYQPGKFYKRELPCALSVLQDIDHVLEAILIDGYVWLNQAEKKPGFGAYLYDALEQRTPTIGVAKSYYKDSSPIEVLRGGSNRPLYITAAGMETPQAAEYVKNMHGKYRIPTLLKLTDEATRQPYR